MEPTTQPIPPVFTARQKRWALKVAKFIAPAVVLAIVWPVIGPWLYGLTVMTVLLYRSLVWGIRMDRAERESRELEALVADDGMSLLQEFHDSLDATLDKMLRRK
jgi:hypothetical protein